MTDGLHVSITDDLILTYDAATETFGLLAKKGAGKSNGAVVLAEEMYGAGIPFVAIDPKGDWWGIRSSADGKSPGLAVVVFGGKHGDVPLEPTGGALVADLVLGDDDRGYLSCVIDVSQFTISEQRRFLLDFGERLFRQKDEERVLHLFLEEAHEYLPQSVPRESTRLVSTYQRIVKQGRFKGLGVTLISQRSAALNKDVLTQVDSLIVLRTRSPQDRAAVKGWVEVHADAGNILGTLHELAPGEAWLWTADREPLRFQFRRRWTFDSGATPKVGQTRVVPRTLADVDLGALKDAMAETIEKAKADDPRELRRRIAALERELATAATVQEVEVVREVPILTDTDRLLVSELIDTLNDAGQHASTIELALGSAQRLAAVEAPKPPPARTSPAARREPKPTAVAPTPDSGVELRAGARRMVEALGRMAPLRLTMGQWGTVAHFKTTGGTWRTYLGEIRRAGLIDENSAGFTLTDAGFDFIGCRPAPMTGRELQDHYRAILRAGAAKMLDTIIAAHPASITIDALGDATGFATTGGTFRTYIGELTRNGLAERDAYGLRATDILMYGAEQ